MKSNRAAGLHASLRMWRPATLALLAAIVLMGGPSASYAKSAAELKIEGNNQLAKLRRSNAAADRLASTAKGVLVFPNIIKAGFLFGGQLGEGVLLEGTQPTGYYNTVAASYGLQAGFQQFGYALFFMDSQSLASFKNSRGFEIGVGPSIVVVDAGLAKTLTTTTVKSGIYAFVFDQSGLMAGLGLQGSKITRISK